METIMLTIFWMIGISWATYYWYWLPNRINNTSKVDFDFDKRHSTSSIESSIVEYSDIEGIRRKNMQRLKCEIKTRWPSKKSLNGSSYKSF